MYIMVKNKKNIYLKLINCQRQMKITILRQEPIMFTFDNCLN